MENPRLIEEISNLAKGGQNLQSNAESPPEVSEKAAEVTVSDEPTVTYADIKPRKSRRSELLSAMKPYLSSERAKALDSVLTIAEILNLMKER